MFSPIQTQKRLIITGSDSEYYPLLQELLSSLRSFPVWENIHIACLDGGLTSKQKTTLLKQGIILKKPLIADYFYKNPSYKKHLKQLKKRPNLAINLSKLWLEQIFPEYDTLLWLDSDIWIQEDSALHLFFQAAEEESLPLAIVPELFTHKPFRVRWLPFGLTQIRSILYKNGRIARLPLNICKKIGTRPTLNSGAFALSSKAPHWKRLRFWQKYCLQHGKLFSSDQLSKALCIYHDNMPIKFLPVKNNYMGPFYYNKETQKLCEAFYPHNPIALIHLAGLDKTRKNPSHQEEILDTTHHKLSMSIRYKNFSPSNH